jgi:uncharacterized membrane protein YedE/YeeE
MQGFTPGSALAGGALIGLAASMLLYLTGRTAGISGIVAGLVKPVRDDWGWRAAFVGGLLMGGVVLLALAPATIGPSPLSHLGLAGAGLLVGFGARLGDGCTSGHGLCGLSRLSRRSLVATAVFIAAGVATVASTPWVAGLVAP